MKSSQGAPDVPQNQNVQPSDLDFPVVGIGASAGGFQALKSFFEHMPQNNGMAFVIVLHLSPDHESIADKIVQVSTKMPVLQVTGPTPIEKNKVYVISPAHQLKMNDGYLQASAHEPRRGGHIAIDLFFRDLADVHKERSFCVVLSGTGSDGAVGLARIKEQGGVTLAQLPDDAEFDSMPKAAIGTGMVDLVLPAVEMPQKLMELWHNAQNIRLPNADETELRALEPASEHEAVLAVQALRDVLVQLRTGTGYDFKHYKQATVLRRIERRMQVTAQPTLPAYHKYLENHPHETRALLGDMLIGVTNFFRDRDAFEALEREILPQVVKGSSQDSKEVRVWSAGCSTGEEAYTLAMLLTDQLQIDEKGKDVRMQIFATDIDHRAISVARTGCYSEAIVTDVPPTRLRQYFVKENSHYRIRKEIRERVLFAQHSLLSDPPFSQIDLVVCRNLMIYLDREVQREILEMFHFALRPGGFLFLGSSESADACTDLFAPVDKKNRIYRALDHAGALRRAPSMPRLGTLRSVTEIRTAETVRPKKKTFADIHLRAIGYSAPPSVILDVHGDILHVSEDASKYLRYVGGEMSHQLVTLIDPALRLDLRTALFQAQQSGQEVRSRPVSLRRDDLSYDVGLQIKPYKDDETGGDFVLVAFLESLGQDPQSVADSMSFSENLVMTNLEAELQRTKLQLQETIEQSEISAEELKASNEEMQAINEELRSATEELETSKEELQSINEELLTVNHELKTKVDETDKANDYLTNLIASTDIATVFVDRGLRIKWFTPAATEIFSMLAVDTGRSLLDITHRLEYDEMGEDASLVFESLNVIEREICSIDKQRWFIARLLPYRSNDDTIDGTVLTFIDITKRRAAEEDLRLSEERMRLVAESTRDYAIIIQDEAGIVTSWNKGAELIFGYSRKEAEGRYFDFIFTEADRAAGIPEQELREARRNGRAEDDRWHLRKDGSQFFCSGEVSLLKGENFKGYVKMARDLTDHKHREEEQSQRLAQTQTSDHLKDEFFAVMSHELKHPLNLIQLNAELLRRLPVLKTAPVAVKAVETVCEAVTSQARIIDDLLDVARIRTGKLKLRRMPINLGKVLSEIHGVLLNNHPTRAITLTLPTDDEEALIVDADPTRLEQIVWNLVNNALKFTPQQGRIQLIASRSGDHAKLEVIDSGTGLDSEQLDQVFDLFSQAENQHASHQREGLGIGLSLVRQLAQAHGGEVQAYSEGEGLGCTFTVLLPLISPTASLPDDKSCDEPAGRLAGWKVLLVDDSPEVLETLSLLLEMEEADIHAFSDPFKALEAAKSASYDVIISDIGMPGMNGHELMKALRQLPGSATTPSVALTGYGTGKDVQLTLQAGFNCHIGKPVAYDVLIETLERARGA